MYLSGCDLIDDLELVVGADNEGLRQSASRQTAHAPGGLAESMARLVISGHANRAPLSSKGRR